MSDDDDDQNAAPIFDEPIPAAAPIKKIVVRDKPNPRWSSHFTNKLLTVKKAPIFGPDDIVYTIGSCFAERIRIALTAERVNVGPYVGGIPMAAENYRIDNLPSRPHMNYYNSFTIRQEFERHIGVWRQADDDFWVHPRDKFWGGEAMYQDPYRRAVFGRTPESLMAAVRHLDRAIDESIRQASVFFITLGMAEVFRNKKTGLMACQKPGYAGGVGEEETEFHMSTYEENLDNMSRVVEIITGINPDARIVVTVSPVGLARTFGEDDIITANTEGKSLLRTVLGALARKYENVVYFPSYEIVMANSPVSFREDDGRHVANWVVSKIVKAFKEAHYDPNFKTLAAAAE
ncbi:GSCFA domain-containing protein [Mesorhizobium sp. IMUNJ 23232]|uniref:GSCFA domain-containing protein n=1 Tax=Mesorhizobium sp. IMUNJ 23232 TaxID=3376064 RepID=UPI00378D8FEF